MIGSYPHLRRAGLPLLLVTSVSAACGDLGPPTAPVRDAAVPGGVGAPLAESHEPLGFMTRNAYVGTDLTPVIEAAGTGDPIALITAAAAAWDAVQASRIPERAGTLAGEIVMNRPHLVGLQEVFRFVELDADLQPTGLVLDMLASLEAELAARGGHYATVAVQRNTSSTIPVAFDPGTGQVTRWVSFTDRIAVLARHDVMVEDVAQAAYQAKVPVGEGFDVTRGWIRVTAPLAGVRHHFVTTHLEVQPLAPVQAAQALELRGSVLAGLEGVTVLVGDLNSDAEAAPGAPSWTPTYGGLVADGFTDLQELDGGKREVGYTCCHAPDLRNAGPALDQRIDFVLVRSTGALHLDEPGRVRVDVVGDGPGDRTPGPDRLWPSDHAGVVAALGVRSGLLTGR